MGTELVLGTVNPAKIRHLRGALARIGINLIAAGELGVELDVPETGNTAQENANLKAKAFAKALKRTVLAMDNALYLDGLSPEEQPGLHVRRIVPGGGRASDETVLAHYTALAERRGGSMHGHWKFGLALAGSQGAIAETTLVSPCQWRAPPSPHRAAGYPLESIQVEALSGKHLVELTAEERDAHWWRSMGEPLTAFLRRNLL